MTTLLLVHKRIGSLSMPFHFESVEERFGVLNKSGVFSLLILTSLFMFAVAYIASLYVSFSFGFGIQQGYERSIELEKQVVETELMLQQKIDALARPSFQKENLGGLARSKTDVIESMEKVSEIKYLTSENVAMTLSTFQP